MKKYVSIYLKDDVKEIINNYPYFSLSDFIHEQLPSLFYDIKTREDNIKRIEKQLEKEKKELQFIKDTIQEAEKQNIIELNEIIKIVKERGKEALKPCYKRYCDSIKKQIPYVLFIKIVHEKMKRGN